MSFLGEVKRRKIFQVAAVYAVVAWLLIQIVATVEEPLSLPGWFDTAIIVLLAVGFPIAIILAWAFDLTPQGVRSPKDVQAGSLPTQNAGQWLSYISQALVLLAVGFLVLDQYLFDDARRSAGAGISRSAAQTVVRSTIVHPGDVPVNGATSDAKVAISSDGGHVAYLVGPASTTAVSTLPLYVRALDQFEPILLSSSARSPFFSPDGQWIGFVENNRQLSKVAVTGGPSVPLVTLDDNNSIRGASWGDDDTIVYATGESSTGLLRISASGGEVEVLTKPDSAAGEADHLYPSFLPDGRGVLFTIADAERIESSQIALLDLETGNYRVLFRSGSFANYSESGHIVYGAAETLFAVPFDLERLTVSGNPVPVLEGVVTGNSGSSAFSLAANGTLVYLTGDADDRSWMLVWVDRDGQEEPIPADVLPYGGQRLSPDGQRVALVVGSRNDSDIWIYDLLRDTMSRLTFDPATDVSPVWTPDAARVLFASPRAGGGIFAKAADGTGSVEAILKDEGNIFGDFLSPDGDQLVFERRIEDFDLEVVSITDGTKRSLIEDPGDQEFSSLSPDGRWIAYESDESGASEIYVRPFPDVNAGKWQVSSSGGQQPLWGPKSRELFYLGPDAMMAIDIESDPTFSAGLPKRLFSTDGYAFSTQGYSVSPDGHRFLMFKPVTGNDSGETNNQLSLRIVQNWFEELNLLAPTLE
jgi:serine/threonine-protein kinase